MKYLIYYMDHTGRGKPTGHSFSHLGTAKTFRGLLYKHEPNSLFSRGPFYLVAEGRNGTLLPLFS